MGIAYNVVRTGYRICLPLSHVNAMRHNRFYGFVWDQIMLNNKREETIITKVYSPGVCTATLVAFGLRGMLPRVGLRCRPV